MSNYIPVVKIQMVRESRLVAPSSQIRCPQDAADILYKYLGNEDREHFVVLLLDTKHKVIGINTVSIGSLDSAIVHPREVFKPAILANVSGIIVAHQHPSGDPTPSPEDISVTKRLVEAGRILGIDVLDHIVVGDGTYKSIKDSSGHVW